MIDAALRAVRARSELVPDVAIILGTGLGGLARELAVATRIPYQEIPGFPLSTVESHAGELLFGTLAGRRVVAMRSEEHTSELQSRLHLVCRLLLEKKKITVSRIHHVASTV